MDGYVVILFGGSSGEWCSLNKCPMGSAEWFPTNEEARDYMSTLPEWTEPHLILVSSHRYEQMSELKPSQ